MGDYLEQVQTSDDTNVGRFKRRTGTNIGLVQMSHWYKHRTGANVGLVKTSHGYKRRTLLSELLYILKIKTRQFAQLLYIYIYIYMHNNSYVNTWYVKSKDTKVNNFFFLI